eukprot:5852820-Amphidinium_carterae.1
MRLRQSLLTRLADVACESAMLRTVFQRWPLMSWRDSDAAEEAVRRDPFVWKCSTGVSSGRRKGNAKAAKAQRGSGGERPLLETTSYVLKRSHRQGEL